MAGRIAAGTDNATAPGTHGFDPGAFDAAEAGGAAPDRLARSHSVNVSENGAAAGPMAQDGLHLA
jgi:hypothetical protein